MRSLKEAHTFATRDRHYFSLLCSLGCPCYMPKDTALQFLDDTGEESEGGAEEPSHNMVTKGR